MDSLNVNKDFEEQLLQLVEDFGNEYQAPHPYNEYVNSWSITTLEIAQMSGLELKPGDSLDDMCICVGFRKEPPADLYFPQEYRGVRVFLEKNEKKYGEIVDAAHK